jgi:PPOX class probable F420-dependent enzyme
MGAMTDDEIVALLDGPEIGVLATADASGKPEGSPVWFDYEGGVVRVLVHRDSRKARNIRENAHVSFTVDTRSAPYRGVVLRGTATLSGPAPALRRRLAHKYLGPETGDRYLAKTEPFDREDALVTILVTGRYSWDYSKGY